MSEKYRRGGCGSRANRQEIDVAIVVLVNVNVKVNVKVRVKVRVKENT